METKDIKAQVEGLFFIDQKKLKDIAAELNLSRKTVYSYLKNNKNYKSEKEKRKKINEVNRKEKKKHWDKVHRKRKIVLEKAILKNQHIRDVKTLSFEKF